MANANAVGVRELRRDLSRYLPRVERGERSAIPASLDLLDLEPLELPGGPPLTELLEQDRADRL